MTSRDLFHDYEPSCGPSFEALLQGGHLPHVHRAVRDHRHRVAVRRAEAVRQHRGHDGPEAEHHLPDLLDVRVPGPHPCHLGVHPLRLRGAGLRGLRLPLVVRPARVVHR